MTTHRSYPLKHILLAAFAAAVVLFLLITYRALIWDEFAHYYTILTDREKTKAFISSFGAGAPLIFMLLQILQVMLAPIPGEATGFIGGYLFGAGKGFAYSSIALAVGSLINFTAARLFGRPLVNRLIPADKLSRFEHVLKRQGTLVLFFLFIFPGFPKDYLCYFLGLSTFPFRIFILLASIGRMPGTVMLSLQGAFLYERSYGLLAVILGMCLILVLGAYRYRERLYQWAERLNNR